MNTQIQEFIFLWFFFVAQRVYEIWLTKKNERSLRQNLKFREVGVTQRKLMIALHVMWFVSLLLESLLWGEFIKFPYIFICVLLLLLAQFLRYRSILDLGELWSTRVYVFDRPVTINHGIYKYLNHPNYIAVLIEFIAVPLYFSCWWTFAVFFPLNLIFLYFRINLEDNLHTKHILRWYIKGGHI